MRRDFRSEYITQSDKQKGARQAKHFYPVSSHQYQLACYKFARVVRNRNSRQKPDTQYDRSTRAEINCEAPCYISRICARLCRNHTGCQAEFEKKCEFRASPRQLWILARKMPGLGGVLHEGCGSSTRGQTMSRRGSPEIRTGSLRSKKLNTRTPLTAERAK